MLTKSNVMKFDSLWIDSSKIVGFEARYDTIVLVIEGVGNVGVANRGDNLMKVEQLFGIIPTPTENIPLLPPPTKTKTK